MLKSFSVISTGIYNSVVIIFIVIFIAYFCKIKYLTKIKTHHQKPQDMFSEEEDACRCS